MRNIGSGIPAPTRRTAIPESGFIGLYDEKSFSKKKPRKLSNDEVVAQLQKKEAAANKPSFATRVERFRITRNFGEFKGMLGG